MKPKSAKPAAATKKNKDLSPEEVRALFDSFPKEVKRKFGFTIKSGLDMEAHNNWIHTVLDPFEERYRKHVRYLKAAVKKKNNADSMNKYFRWADSIRSIDKQFETLMDESEDYFDQIAAHNNKCAEMLMFMKGKKIKSSFSELIQTMYIQSKELMKMQKIFDKKILAMLNDFKKLDKEISREIN